MTTVLLITHHPHTPRLFYLRKYLARQTITVRIAEYRTSDERAEEEYLFRRPEQGFFSRLLRREDPQPMPEPIQPVGSVEEILADAKGCDVIISSSPPFSCHEVAAEVHQRTGIPWIADVRNLIGFTNPKLVKEATVVLAAPEYEYSLGDDVAEPIILTDGYDPEEVVPQPVAEKFALSYNLPIYPSWQSREMFDRVVRQMIGNGRIGRDDITITGAPFGSMPGTQVILWYNWETMKDKVHPQYVFDSLGAKRPILAVGGYGNDFLESLLQRSGCGKYEIRDFRVADALEEYYREWKEKGFVEYRGDPEMLKYYSWEYLGKEWADTIRSALESPDGTDHRDDTEPDDDHRGNGS